MTKNRKMLVTVLSASLIVIMSLILGLEMKKEKDKSITNQNSANNHVVEIKNICEEGAIFPNAIEEYYKDDQYVCTFNQIKSGCYIVEVDGKKYSLKEALNNTIITVEEAISKGMNCKEIVNSNSSSSLTNSSDNRSDNKGSNSGSNDKVSSNTNTNFNTNVSGDQVPNSNTNNTNSSSSNVISNSNVAAPNQIRIIDKCGKYTTQQIDEFYQDSKYIYYFNSGRSGCTYVSVNGKEYSLKNALNSEVVTMKQLEDIGFQCLKKSRNLANS